MSDIKQHDGTITIKLNAFTGLIAFNVVMLLVYIGLDFYNFNYAMSFLGNASNQQITSSFSVLGYSVGINSNIGSNYYVMSSQGFATINFAFIAVLVLIIGNIVGLVRLRKK